MNALLRWQQRFEDQCLHSAKACTYMAARGITPSMRDRWGIGFCNEYDETYKVLYKRLTFPIYDWRGRLVSFSGRTLRNSTRGPKYIALPDNEAFKKSQQLYGLNYAMPAIAKSRVAIVTEGFTDVIGLHDLCGVTNTVSSMGVALTKAQLKLLARWAKLVIIVLDGDAAGARATERLLSKLEDSSVELAHVKLPVGKDPFDLSLEMGPDFAAYLKAHVSGKQRLPSR